MASRGIDLTCSATCGTGSKALSAARTTTSVLGAYTVEAGYNLPLALALAKDHGRRVVGFAGLEVLACSRLPGEEQLRLLEVAWQPGLNEEVDKAEQMLDDGERIWGRRPDRRRAGTMSGAESSRALPGRGAGGRRSESNRPVGELRARVQAARLRLITDRRQGKPSSERVRRLAGQGC